MAAALERALGPAAAAGSGSGAALPPLPVLLTGPAGSGRTSLLLRAALAGGADGPRALFLAPSAVPRLPGGSGGTGTDPRALQRLELRYPRTRLSLCRELLSLSLSPSLSPLSPSLSPPPVVLLDGLERYLCPVSPSATARLAALLLELSLSPPVPSRPQLVAALRLPPPGGAVTLGTLLRFFPARCHLRGDTRGQGHVWVTLRCPGRQRGGGGCASGWGDRVGTVGTGMGTGMGTRTARGTGTGTGMGTARGTARGTGTARRSGCDMATPGVTRG